MYAAACVERVVNVLKMTTNVVVLTQKKETPGAARSARRLVVFELKQRPLHSRLNHFEDFTSIFFGLTFSALGN